MGKRERERKGNKEVRERGEKKDKQRWCFRASGRHGGEKGGGGGITGTHGERETDCERNERERQARVGGRQGKTGEEREDAKMKE